MLPWPRPQNNIGRHWPRKDSSPWATSERLVAKLLWQLHALTDAESPSTETASLGADKLKRLGKARVAWVRGGEQVVMLAANRSCWTVLVHCDRAQEDCDLSNSVVSAEGQAASWISVSSGSSTADHGGHGQTLRKAYNCRSHYNLNYCNLSNWGFSFNYYLKGLDFGTDVISTLPLQSCYESIFCQNGPVKCQHDPWKANARSYKLNCNSNQWCIMPRYFPKGGSLTPHLQIILLGTSVANLITDATIAVKGNKARGISYSSPLCQVD